MKINFHSIVKKSLVYVLCILVMFSSTVYAQATLSSKELEELEKEFVQLINQSDRVIREPLVVQYINHLGKKLATHLDLHSPYFFVVNSDVINAFAGPGGYIGINSRLILATSNESELAGVMSHELSHVAANHLYRMIEHQKQMRIPMIASSLAAIALGLINPSLAGGVLMASMSGYAQESINFTRANEKEADRLGIDVLHKAGLDPNGMANFFKKMQQNDRYYYTAHIPAILRTHPLDQDRIAEAEDRIARYKLHKVSPSLSYALFKEQLRTLTTNNTITLINFYQQKLKKYKNAPTIKYGYALTLIKRNRYHRANKLLATLVKLDPDNLHFQIAMAQTEFGLKQYHTGLQRLQELAYNYPDNYAAIMSYAQGLSEANKPMLAATVLRKNRAQFPKDTAMCFRLARNYANAKRLSSAYLTQAKCLLLQGRKKKALEQLKHAKKYTHHNQLQKARISALINDLKS